MKHENQSLYGYIEYWNEIQQREPLKSKIKENEVLSYFNYGLNTITWNTLVNKQIFMKFERLLIEKQLHDKEKREKELTSEIDSLKQEIDKYIKMRT